MSAGHTFPETTEREGPSRSAHSGPSAPRITVLLGLAALLAAPVGTEAQGVATSSRQNGLFFGGSSNSSSLGRMNLRTRLRFGSSAVLRGSLSAFRGQTEVPDRVPINAHTMADGTANTVPPVPDPPERFVRPGLLQTGGPFFQYLFPTRVVAVPYAAGVATRPEPRRRRLPRLPASVRSEPAGQPAPTSDRAAPRVRPPTSPSRTESLPLEACAEVRITTAGGIQWRQRVGLGDLEVASPADAAKHLQKRLREGEPLSIHGPDGSFTVPAHLVQTLIVGPCNG